MNFSSQFQVMSGELQVILGECDEVVLGVNVSNFLGEFRR